MLFPVQSGRAGQHFGCVKVMNIAILTDADKEHYKKILFCSIKEPFYAPANALFKVSCLDSTIKLNIKHQTRIKISIRT